MSEHVVDDEAARTEIEARVFRKRCGRAGRDA